MAFSLPKLPYSKDALAPYISEETLEYHYEKHHNAYINNLNKLIVGTEFEDASLEEIILKSSGSIFNNAAQVWNHSFYWKCLKPNAALEPKGFILDAIYRDFGSFAQFQEQFTQVAMSTFGSGWTWLVQDEENDKFKIISTSNAGTPMKEGLHALLTCDVWEHAYYIDYRNSRPDYLKAFWSVIDWDFVAENLFRLIVKRDKKQ